MRIIEPSKQKTFQLVFTDDEIKTDKKKAKDDANKAIEDIAKKV